MEAKRCFCGKARPSYATPGSNEPTHCARQACCSAATVVTAQQWQVLLRMGVQYPDCRATCWAPCPPCAAQHSVPCLSGCGLHGCPASHI